MRKTVTIPVQKRPVDLSSAIKVMNVNTQNVEFGGALVQSLDMVEGVYSPNRNTNPTILGLDVKTINRNTASPTAQTVSWTAAGNSITWKYSINGGSQVTVTTLSTGNFRLNNSKQLVVSYNMEASDTSVIIYAIGVFKDPTDNSKSVTVEESVPLGLVKNSQHSLKLERILPNITVNGVTGIDRQYAGNLAVINTPKLAVYEANQDIPWKIDRESEWQRKCRVQLYNGSTPLDDLHTDLTDITPDGVALYYWFTRGANGALQPISESNPPSWLVASYVPGNSANATLWYRDGTMTKEVMVTFALRENPVDDIHLICRAAFIPYGTYTDYLDSNNNKIDLTKVWNAHNWRDIDFHLRVKWPTLDGVDMCSMSMPVLQKIDIGSTTKKVKRRAMIQVGRHTVMDPSVKQKPTAANNHSVAEKLYTINWLLVDAQDNLISTLGTGEWLETTPYAIGQYMLALDVEPKKSYAAIVPAPQS